MCNKRRKSTSNRPVFKSYQHSLGHRPLTFDIHEKLDGRNFCEELFNMAVFIDTKHRNFDRGKWQFWTKWQFRKGSFLIKSSVDFERTKKDLFQSLERKFSDQKFS